MKMVDGVLDRVAFSTRSSVRMTESIRELHQRRVEKGGRRGLRNWLARAAAEAQDSGRFPDV